MIVSPGVVPWVVRLAFEIVSAFGHCTAAIIRYTSFVTYSVLIVSE